MEVELCKTLKNNGLVCVVQKDDRYSIKYRRLGEETKRLENIDDLLAELHSDGVDREGVDEAIAWVRKAMGGGVR